MSKLKNHPALMRRLELALVNLCLIEFLIHEENEKLSSKKGKSLMSHTKANLQWWCSTVQLSFETKFFLSSFSVHFKHLKCQSVSSCGAIEKCPFAALSKFP